ncbi:hypothetical protein [Sideroxydans sp. CL21]|uniref:hypothetical protein n=1 Tax=Sideroxydans sp. CL21 TaxID=2600596 RepID=UPI0024BD51DB|nr:hypothetical protein [Sideroxydans sp. CL21]
MAKDTQPVFVPVSGVVHSAVSQRLSELFYRYRQLHQMSSDEVFNAVMLKGIEAMEKDSSTLKFETVDINSINTDHINAPDWQL